MTRPHEDPACRCKACVEWDNRGQDIEFMRAGAWSAVSQKTIEEMQDAMFEILRIEFEG